MKLKYNLEDDVLVITLKDEPLSYGEEVTAEAQKRSARKLYLFLLISVCKVHSSTATIS